MKSLRSEPCSTKGELARVQEFLKNLKAWTLNAFKCGLHCEEITQQLRLSAKQETKVDRICFFSQSDAGQDWL